MPSSPNKRIYDFARELGLESADVIRLAREAGVDVPNSVHASLDPYQQERLRKYVNGHTAPLTRTEIASLSNAAQVALAARCAFRVAPAMVHAIEAWDESATSQHVRAIDAATWLAVNETRFEPTLGEIYGQRSAFARPAAAAAAKAAAAARNAATSATPADARDTARASSRDATRAAADAADAAYAAANAAAANAAAAAARAAARAYTGDAAEAAYDASRAAFYQDFRLLREHLKSRVVTFFERPLWDGPGPPFEWARIVEGWLAALPPSCKRIGDRYVGMLEGRMDWEGGLADLDAWIAEDVDHEGKLGVAADDEPSESGPEVVPLSATITATSQVTADAVVIPPNTALIPPGDNSPVGVASAIGDRKAERDLLGRAPLVAALAAMFRSPEQDTPFTVGLLGDWGSGKSSVLFLVEEELKRRSKTGFDVAWFDAWEYEKTDNVAAGLAQEVTRTLVSGPFGSWRRFRFACAEAGWTLVVALSGVLLLMLVVVQTDVRTAIAKALNLESLNSGASWLVTGLIGLLAIGFLLNQFERLLKTSLSTWFGGVLQLLDYRNELGTIPILKRQIETLAKLRLGQVRRLPRELRRREARRIHAVVRSVRRACRRWLPEIWSDWVRRALVDTERRYRRWRLEDHPERRRLLVYVDNLDRCRTECIVDVLDAVRLVMDLDHVIVVVAVDHKIALQAVAKHYENLATPGRSADEIARDYLAKIVQLPIRLRESTDLDAFVHDKLFPNPVERPTGEWERPRTVTQTSVSTSEPPFRTLDEQPLPQDEPSLPGSSVPASDPETERPETERVRTDATDNGEPADGPPDDEQRRHDGAHKEEAVTDSDESTTGPIRVDADVLEAEMQDDTNERREFAALTQLFGIDNPRRLVRLRNSYRVLKLVNRIEADGDGKEPHHRADLMLLLFWQEFLGRLTRRDRETVSKLGSDPDALSDWEYEVYENQRECKPVFEKLTRDTDRCSALLRLSNEDSHNGLVGSLILPFSETMVGLRQEQEEAAVDDAGPQDR